MSDSLLKTSPLVSVIIPTYKRAHLVARAIQSVLNQTVADIEVIVVDDGSPDNTEEMVRRMADPRVCYIRREINSGRAAAGRNTGISVAKGQYIAFLDDDDEWRADKLERQLAAIESHDAVLCGALVNGARVKSHNSATVTHEDLRRGNPFDPSGLLAKASVLRELRFDEDLKYGEDWDICIRIVQRYSIGYVPEPLVLYNDGGHQRITNDARHKMGRDLEKRTAVLQKHMEFFGVKWFRYYYADTLMSYLGSRKSRFQAIVYAVKRCGISAVLKVMTEKIRRHLLAAIRRDT